MPNLYKLFRSLVPDPPLLVGTVAFVQSDGCHIQLPDGGMSFARGEGTLGQRVFFRDGVIEGSAPQLAIETIEV